MDFRELFEHQLESQVERGASRPADRPDTERMEYLRTQALGAVAELMEALDENGWKPWKREGFGETRAFFMGEEIADVIVFVTNMALAAGLTADDIDGALRRTFLKNSFRQKSGY